MVRSAKIEASPYPDGSGYRATAKVLVGDDGAPVVELHVLYQMPVTDWPEFRRGIDAAIKMVSGDAP